MMAQLWRPLRGRARRFDSLIIRLGRDDYERLPSRPRHIKRDEPRLYGKPAVAFRRGNRL